MLASLRTIVIHFQTGQIHLSDQLSPSLRYLFGLLLNILRMTRIDMPALTGSKQDLALCAVAGQTNESL